MGGVKKVPMIMQMEALECGAACLAMILAYHGKWVPLEQVREDCGVSRDGSRAKNMIVAARSYGLEAAGYSYSLEGIRKAELPCIIYWNFNHFVVLDGFSGDKVCINDPARGVVKVSMEEFDRSFTGIALCFRKTDAFQPGGEPASVVDFAKSRLKGLSFAIALVAITAALASLVNITNAAFSRVFVDRILSGVSTEWLLPLIGVMALVAAIQCAVGFINAIYVLRIQGKLAVTSSSRFMWHLLRLPMDFYSQRMVGDLTQRLASNESIAFTLVSQLAPVLLNIVLLVFYLIVMLRYSVLLSLVGIATVILNMIVMRIIARKRVNVTRVQMRDSGKLYAATVSGIDMIETIKASGAESGYLERWSGYQAAVNTAQVRFQKINQYLGAVPGLVSQLANITVLVLGTWLIMQGTFTIGMLLAFQGFLSGFLSPVNSLLTLGQNVQEMRTSMERVQDVLDYEPDVPESPATLDDGQAYDKLAGAVEASHLTFGYSRLDEPIIRDFNLTMQPGSWTALVGDSGCGKSTIAKLLAGLYQPWEGDIRYDDKPLSEIPRPVLRGSLTVVDQDITLFDDTVEDNIKLWDSSIDDAAMMAAARDADIDVDIMARGNGYEDRVLPSGRNFSGGQRQRLEIARSLAQEPTILILDEATSALDARTEQKVIEAIRARHITCIVVAHRLSTIRDCDQILVIEDGSVVEQGTHDELMKLDGHYADLVRSD